MSKTDRVAAQAVAMAEANTILRKIAAHVPARVWIEAKEKAGYPTEVRAANLDDPKVDEAWLEFVASGDDAESSAARDSAEQSIRVLETPVHGIPSIRVINRKNAVRLLTAAFETIWGAKLQQ